MAGLVPERILLDLLQRGVDAIAADLETAAADASVLDDILATLDSAERTKARTVFGTNPPAVMMGFPRVDGPFPCVAVTLAGDSIDHDYIGVGEHALLDDDDTKIGDTRHRWIAGSFALHIYAQHPDLCAWLYRVMRRILNVGVPWLINRGLHDPTFQGAEMIPNPETPENLFVRRITVTVLYSEEWSDVDALYAALYDAQEPFITTIEQIDVRHEDTFLPGPGGVHPFTIDLSEDD